MNRTVGIGLTGKFALVAAKTYDELRCVHHLHARLQHELCAREGCEVALQSLDMPVCALLTWMELRGVRASIPHLLLISSQIDSKIAQLSAEAQQAVGRVFNLASPEQVRCRKIVGRDRQSVFVKDVVVRGKLHLVAAAVLLLWW